MANVKLKRSKVSRLVFADKVEGSSLCTFILSIRYSLFKMENAFFRNLLGIKTLLIFMEDGKRYMITK